VLNRVGLPCVALEADEAAGEAVCGCECDGVWRGRIESRQAGRETETQASYRAALCPLPCPGHTQPVRLHCI